MNKNKVFILQYGTLPRELGVDLRVVCQNESFEYHLIIDEASYPLVLEKDNISMLTSISQVKVTHGKVPFEDLKTIIDSKAGNSNDIRCIISFYEFCVLDAGRLNQHYGIHDIDYNKFIDKIVMKDIVSKAGISVPTYMRLNYSHYLEDKESYTDYIVNAVGFPAFVKPIDMAGAIGVDKIRDREDLVRWLENDFSTKYTFQIEEFIEGTFYHCESLIQNQKVVYSQVCEYADPLYLTKFGVPLASITLPDDEETQRIAQFCENIHKSLRPLANGLTHLELFKRANGELIFIEVAFRPPGNLSSERV